MQGINVFMYTYRRLRRTHKNGKVCEMIAGAHCMRFIRILSNHMTTLTGPSSIAVNSAVNTRIENALS